MDKSNTIGQAMLKNFTGKAREKNFIRDGF